MLESVQEALLAIAAFGTLVIGAVTIVAVPVALIGYLLKRRRGL
jgi:hypothetical protein